MSLNFQHTPPTESNQHFYNMRPYQAISSTEPPMERFHSNSRSTISEGAMMEQPSRQGFISPGVSVRYSDHNSRISAMHNHLNSSQYHGPNMNMEPYNNHQRQIRHTMGQSAPPSTGVSIGQSHLQTQASVYGPGDRGHIDRRGDSRVDFMPYLPPSTLSFAGNLEASSQHLRPHPHHHVYTLRAGLAPPSIHPGSIINTAGYFSPSQTPSGLPSPSMSSSSPQSGQIPVGQGSGSNLSQPRVTSSAPFHYHANTNMAPPNNHHHYQHHHHQVPYSHVVPQPYPHSVQQQQLQQHQNFPRYSSRGTTSQHQPPPQQQQHQQQPQSQQQQTQIQTHSQQQTSAPHQPSPNTVASSPSSASTITIPSVSPSPQLTIGTTTQLPPVTPTSATPTSLPVPTSSTSSTSTSVRAVAVGVDESRIRQQFRSKIVCQLTCAHCGSVCCTRGMKAILLADMNIELFSTDLPPKHVQLVNEDYQYHVTQPCEQCMESCNNGHFWMFHIDQVVSADRLNPQGTKAMLWANLPKVDRDQDQIDIYDRMCR
ncbi:Protein fam72b [Blyttiomyces sp. JEL0837]|nr:Protein fam72b [Blyttiomyces sp. JEL0837]